MMNTLHHSLKQTYLPFISILESSTDFLNLKSYSKYEHFQNRLQSVQLKFQIFIRVPQ